MTTPAPLILHLTLALGILMLILPRRYVLFPFLSGAFFLTLKPYILLFAGHFTMIRFLVLFGFLRMTIRRDREKLTLQSLDKAAILWILSAVICYTLLWGTAAAFANRIGYSLDTMGVYFLCRAYLRNLEDVVRNLAFCIVLLIPLSLCMLYEHITDFNPFSLLGGVPEHSEIRNDQVRSQGCFMHPILAGTFGATILPLIIALWWQQSVPKPLVLIGFAAALAISYSAGSSGALLATIGGITGLLAWHFRDSMRAIRWSIIGSLFILQLIMVAPIWFVFARLGSLMGGTGWHRAALIDQAIRHFDEWWLIGTRFTANWMATHLAIDPTKSDITNEYLSQGVNGGLLTMFFFILIIIRCFKAVGHSLPFSRDFSSAILIWAMGAAMFAHTMAFFSITYFDQTAGLWFFLIAMIATGFESASLRAAQSCEGTMSAK
jgi:hypothetical protein